MKHVTLCALIISAVSMSGCAQLLNISDKVWTESRDFTVDKSKKAFALLRPRASRQAAVFTNADSHERNAGAYKQDTILSALQGGQSLPINIEFYQMAKTYPSVQAYLDASALEARTIASTGAAMQSAHSASRAQAQGRDDYSQFAGSYSGQAKQSDVPSLSYVNKAGLTSRSDFKDCQSQAGGYIRPAGSTFEVRPDFDKCMRLKGYVPENKPAGYGTLETL